MLAASRWTMCTSVAIANVRRRAPRAHSWMRSAEPAVGQLDEIVRAPGC
jgi:hypothetical protein